MRKFTPYILVACVSVLACLCEATQPADWSRYECIVSRNPFGAKPEPAPVVTTPIVPEVNLFENIQVTALIVGDSGIKVGFVDKKTQDIYLLAQGQAESGIQLVHADYDSESVLLRRNGSEQWVSMPAASSSIGRSAPPRREFTLPERGSQTIPTHPVLSNAEPVDNPTPIQPPTPEKNVTKPENPIRNKRQTKTNTPAAASGTEKAIETKTSLTSTSDNSTYNGSGSVSGSLDTEENSQVFVSSEYQLQQNEDGSYKLSTSDGTSIDIPALEEDNLHVYSASGLECPAVAGNDEITIGMVDDDLIIIFKEDGTETTVISQDGAREDVETDAEPTVAETAINNDPSTQGENIPIYSSPDNEYQIAFNKETGTYTLATPDGVFQFTAPEEQTTINLPGDLKLQLIAQGGDLIVVQLPGDTIGLVDNTQQDEQEDDGDDEPEEIVDIIPLTPEDEDPTTITTGGMGGTVSDGGTTSNTDPVDNTGNNSNGGSSDTGNDDPAYVIEEVEEETNPDGAADPESDPDPETESEPEPEPDPFANLPEEIKELLINPPLDPSPAQERILRRYRYIVPR